MWDWLIYSFLHIPNGVRICTIDGVALWGNGKINGRLGQSQVPLRWTDKVKGLLGSNSLRQGIWIRHTYIL